METETNDLLPSSDSDPSEDTSSAETSEAKSGELETKQAVVHLPKHETRLRAVGMTGKFKDAQFGDDNVSVDPVSTKTREALREEFPYAILEDVVD